MTITCLTILYSHVWEKGVIWQLRLRPQFLAQSAFATYKNTGFILLTIVRWDVHPLLMKPTDRLIF